MTRCYVLVICCDETDNDLVNLFHQTRVFFFFSLPVLALKHGNSTRISWSSRATRISLFSFSLGFRTWIGPCAKVGISLLPISPMHISLLQITSCKFKFYNIIFILYILINLFWYLINLQLNLINCTNNMIFIVHYL